MARIFALEAILGALAIGLVAGIIALIVRLVKGDGAGSLWRALEAFLLATSGAFLARTFISLMLSLGDDSNAAVTVTSFLFFVWPGVINLISLPFGDPIIGVNALLWIALFVGGLIGLFDGLWATHKWAGWGVPEFLLDVTWGLGGNTNAVLMHLINFAWGKHADDAAVDEWGGGGGGVQETRQGAHRYNKGFALKGDFAFTQGAVMSNMEGYPPDSALFRHESIHIWQNRLLGPFFWFSYFGWMVLTFIPALIAGLASNGRKVGDAIQWWTYFDNPWEIMAYGIANPEGRTRQKFSDGTPIEGWCCWPMPVAIGLAVPGVAILLAVFGVIFATGYI